MIGRRDLFLSYPLYFFSYARLTSYLLRLSLYLGPGFRSKICTEKFDHPISYALIFENVFLESHGLAAMPVTSCIKDTCSIYPYLISEGLRNCSYF